jgi:RNA polymerase sigma-70 factor, ECF subfamily
MDDRNEAPDAELAALAGAGDKAAFGALVKRHQVAAVRLATIISGSPDEAPDIVQEAFVKAYRALRSRPVPDMARSWMLRIVANEAHNSRRGSERRIRRDDRYVAWSRFDSADSADAMTAALSAVEAGTLLAAIGRLSVHDREVIGYRYFAGLSEAETAAAVGTAMGTVKSRTARALERLRKDLRARGWSHG